MQKIIYVVEGIRNVKFGLVYTVHTVYERL